MKRTASAILSILILLLTAQDARSTIASPKPFKYRQPDGSTVTVQLHGDEFFHWETIDGKNVALDSKGFYREESKASLQARQITVAAARRSRRAILSATPNSVIRNGNPHFLILLVEFSDVRFTIPDTRTAFSNLLNEPGYSANEGTGSVLDYFRDNSCGKFNPVFDVVGPVRVSRSLAYYGTNNDNARYALEEACRLVDDKVDFSQYDGDGDGVVDNVFFFFAGHNEAEGGGQETIWPHSWNIYDFNCFCDGVRISEYACTSEYRESTGREMCGIGTFCHEFGHTLGLPDLYDTDYGTNGQAFTMSYYSLMCSGNYNNGGHTPPFLLGEERRILGWLEGPEIWTEGGAKTVEPISANKSYRTRTTTEGEWFVFETRNGKSWDSPLPSGLIVTHMDQSERNVHGMTARQRWENWSVNIYGDHPCCYIVTADKDYIERYPFPGALDIREFTAEGEPSFLDWEGNFTGFEINDIWFDGERTSLNLISDKQLSVRGSVCLMDGTPVKGVSVNLTDISATAVRPMDTGPLKASANAVLSATTSANGSYSIKLSNDYLGKAVRISISGTGYRSQSTELTIAESNNKADFIIRKSNDSAGLQLKKYNDFGRMSFGFMYAPQSIQAAVMFSPKELKAYEGEQLSSISFEMSGSSSEDVRVFVEIDGERILTKNVTNPAYNGTNVVDVSNNGIFIPSGKNMYIGYSVKNMNYSYPVTIDTGPGISGGLCYSQYHDNRASWSYDGSYNAIIGASLVVNQDISELGYNYIVLSDADYKVGNELSLELMTGTNPPTSVVWYFDGQMQDDKKVVLTAGTHSITAVLKYSDGNSESLYAEILVN